MKTKEQKRKEAAQRQTAHDQLSLEEKLAKAGTKERTKLLKKQKEAKNER